MPQTGLSQLGEAFARGGSDYANISLRRQAEERQRSQQLADLQDQRAYQRTESDRTRNLQREGEIYHLLITEGWLKPDDAQNPQAIAKAAQDRQDHIDRQMAEQTIQGLNAGERADQVASARDDVQRKVEQLASVLSEPEPEPDRGQVANEAVRIASAGLKAGEAPSEQAIRDAAPAAYAAIRDRQNAEWYRRKQDASVQYQLFQAQLRDLSAESNTLSSKFGKVGVSMPQAAPRQATAPVARPQLTPQDIVARMQEALKARQPATPAAALAVPDAPGMAQGGLQRVIQKAPSALSNFGQFLTEATDTGLQTLGGVGQGLWNGDYGVRLDAKPVDYTSTAIANLFAPQPGDYMSAEKAKAANLRRSLDQPLPPLRPLPSFSFAPGY